MQDETLFFNRMAEKSREADQGGYYTASHFLTLAEQSDLAILAFRGEVGRYFLDGGFEGAERKMAIFGDENELGYSPEPFAVWLSITPTAPKFADALTHRDFLGSLMGLGIKRERLGDLLILDNIGYLYLIGETAPYIVEQLTKVKHTDVRCQVIDSPPQTAVALPEETLIVTAGERLDAVVAAVYRLSRAEAQALLEKGLVFLDGKACDKNAAVPKVGVTVSVRGYGRFRYEGIRGDTKKGKLRIAVRIFS